MSPHLAPQLDSPPLSPRISAFRCDLACRGSTVLYMLTWQARHSFVCHWPLRGAAHWDIHISSAECTRLILLGEGSFVLHILLTVKPKQFLQEEHIISAWHHAEPRNMRNQACESVQGL